MGTQPTRCEGVKRQGPLRRVESQMDFRWVTQLLNVVCIKKLMLGSRFDCRVDKIGTYSRPWSLLGTTKQGTGGPRVGGGAVSHNLHGLSDNWYRCTWQRGWL